MQKQNTFRRNANLPNPVKKGKPKIITINFKEHEQEVKRIWEGKPPANLVERWKKKVIGAIKKNITIHHPCYLE
jgi:hypothetical protein